MPVGKSDNRKEAGATPASGHTSHSDGGFTDALIPWYRSVRRDLPWRNGNDPYLIWLSEVMLQQTRVDQALPFYERFAARFPDVYALAEADLQEVLVLWEGLGYYSRARNLHQAARTVVTDFDGKIPDTMEDIRRLKGVGPYTAAAILSIAFNKPHAVVDGNVLRVIARYCGIEDDLRSVGTRNQIQEIVSEWIPAEAPADFNQGMMELGALICTPGKPKCGECPVSAGCIAFQTARTESIPYKSPSARVPHHDVVVAIIRNPDGKVLISRRPENAMLGGLWEFPGGKKEKAEALEEALHREIREELGVTITQIQQFHQLKHAYSHFKITLHAYICELESGEPRPRTSDEIRWVDVRELPDFPFPKANRTLTRLLAESGGDYGSEGPPHD